jgi:hypothetical protein
VLVLALLFSFFLSQLKSVNAFFIYACPYPTPGKFRLSWWWRLLSNEVKMSWADDFINPDWKRDLATRRFVTRRQQRTGYAGMHRVCTGAEVRKRIVSASIGASPRYFVTLSVEKKNLFALDRSVLVFLVSKNVDSSGQASADCELSTTAENRNRKWAELGRFR